MPSRGSSKLYAVIVLVILSIESQAAQAGSPYSMPTFGASWVNGTINVNLPSSPQTARDTLEKALEIWNEAQLWFKAAYSPGGNVYTFLISNQPKDVLVDLTDYWSVSNYCPSMPLGVEGCTTIHWNDSRNITQAIVFLDEARLTKPNNDSIFLALHEFGHALGLPDLPSTPNSPCPFKDLFCLYYYDEYPSTLDLYALHQLAGGNLETSVSLPPDIPFSYYSPTGNSGTGSSTAPVTQRHPSAYNSQQMNYSINLATLIATFTSGIAILFVICTKEYQKRMHCGPGGI